MMRELVKKISEIRGKKYLWGDLWQVATDNITSSRPGPLVNAPVLSLKYKILHNLSNNLNHFPFFRYALFPWQNFGLELSKGERNVFEWEEF